MAAVPAEGCPAPLLTRLHPFCAAAFCQRCPQIKQIKSGPIFVCLRDFRAIFVCLEYLIKYISNAGQIDYITNAVTVTAT